MKRNFPLVVFFVIVFSLMSNGIYAQWRKFDKGLPSSFLNSGLVVFGTNVIVGNAHTLGTSYSVYFTPDTTTKFTASGSNMGGGALAEIPHNIVACKGELFTINQHGVYKSPDDGETWGKTSVTDTSYTPGNASYIWSNGNDLWAFAPPKVFESTDGGVTWSYFTYSKIDSKINAFYAYKGVLYTGGKSGIIYSANNGASWDTVKAPSGLAGASVAEFALLKGNVYAATAGGIYMETDSGANWTQVFSKNAVSICSAGSVLIACTGAPYDGIYKSDSNGQNWTAINSGLDYASGYPVLGALSSNDKFVVAGVTDTGSFTSGLTTTLYISTLSSLGIPAGVNTINKPAASVLVYPNPAYNSATLLLNGAYDRDINVSICDMSGKVVRVDNYYNSPIITLNLSDIAAGMYMLRVSDATHVVTKKLIVQ